MIMTLQKIVLVVPLLCVSMTFPATLSASAASSKRNNPPAGVSPVKGKSHSQGTSLGESARGEIESEGNGVLRLNTKPCKRDTKPTVFTAPYDKREAGEAVCRRGIFGLWRKTVKIYVITQR